ncbi:MAG: class I SAM-dependent methyltransferase, partial [Candidatus Heimdallarchaeota archaeon]|nr:class I SAM-dependent methyltransferase [Candidatus Heimdallarchaeota archaeon]
IKWLEEIGEIKGDVLDVGCGTGQNSLFLANKGYTVTGIDKSDKSVNIVKERAQQRKLNVEIVNYDIFELKNYPKSFDTIIDSSIFHMFSDEKRIQYEKNIRSVIKEGGTYHMLVFSDKETENYGPRRIKKEEIKKTFSEGWDIYRIKEARIRINIGKGWVWAWLASLTKIDI